MDAIPSRVCIGLLLLGGHSSIIPVSAPPALQGLILLQAQQHIPAVSCVPASASVRLPGGETRSGTDEPKPLGCSHFSQAHQQTSYTSRSCLSWSWQGQGMEAAGGTGHWHSPLLPIRCCMLVSAVQIGPSTVLSQCHPCSVHSCSAGDRVPPVHRRAGDQLTHCGDTLVPCTGGQSPTTAPSRQHGQMKCQLTRACLISLSTAVAHLRSTVLHVLGRGWQQGPTGHRAALWAGKEPPLQ